MDIAQSVRLLTKTRKVMGSTRYNPSSHIYSTPYLIPLKPPPKMWGRLIWVLLMKISKSIWSIL